MRRSVRLRLLAAFAVMLAAGCAGSRPVPMDTALRRDTDDLEPATLALAAERSAAALERMNGDRMDRFAGGRVRVRDLAASARRVAEIARETTDGESLTRRLARECRAWPAGEPAKVTGYYEPVLDARGKPDSRFRYPLYAKPSGSQLRSVERRLGHAPTRDDIDRGGALDGLGLEIAWVDDPVARFFLHIQGSGRLRFADGNETRVGFAASNDLPYRSIGTAMLRRGLLEHGAASATAMRRWLAEHPDQRDALLAENPRYVFFRGTGAEGPFGALGVALVPGRSIATDDDHVPRGLLVWLRTTRPVVDPDGKTIARKRLTRFVFAQDAGAAIKGPARVDLFVGSGEEAGREAGAMNEPGELYVLLCAKQ